MMKMCLNWKVLAGLAIVGIGIFLFAPHLILAALPLLLLAACPLSMLLMMKGMGGMHGTPAASADNQAGATGRFTCPMHPAVRRDQPGRCPECGMPLVLSTQHEQLPSQSSAMPSASLTRAEQLALLKAQLQSVNIQQAALARQLEQLETTKPDAEAASSSLRVVQEAEEVANTAAERQ